MSEETSAPVGLLFCRALIKAKSLKVLRDFDLTSEMIYDEARKALEAIVDHHKKFGALPTTAWVKRKTGVELPSGKGLDLPETYAEELRQRYVGKVLTDELREINKAVRENPEEGAIRLQKAWATVQSAKLTRRTHLVNVTDPKRVDERKEKYDRLESHKGFDGVLFPWQSLNESCMGMQPGTVHIFSAMEKTGKCLSADTPVVCANTGQLRTIEEVVRRKLDVFSFDAVGESKAKLKAITPDAWLPMGKKKCLKLTTRLGRVVEATPEHPLLTSRGWVRLDELTTADEIASVARYPEIKTPTKLPMHEVELLAQLLADGNYTAPCAVRLSKRDETFLANAARCARLIGSDMRPLRADDCSFEFRPYMPMRALLDKHDCGFLLSKHKRVPQAIFSLPKSQLRRFLMCFWWGDGDASDGELGLASEGLIDDLQHLFLRLGVVTRKHYKVARCAGKSFDSWKLTVQRWTYPEFKHVMRDMPGPKGEAIRSLQTESRAHGNNVQLFAELEAAIRRCGVANRGFFQRVAIRLGWSRPECSGSFRTFTSINGGVRCLSRKTLAAVIDEAGGALDDFRWLLSRDIVFDRVQSIEASGIREVFDLTVLGSHCFVAADVVVHNTFLLVECAAHCWANQEKPPLFVTMEMPPDQIERRFDASAGKFAYERLRKARLGVFAKKGYFKFLDGLKEKRPFWIADSRSVRTVEEIANLAVELDVSAVYLDGVYILARHGAEAMWERTLEVVASCKDQAKITQLPWVLTTQLATSLKADATTATTRDLGYAKMIAQWADAIYAFFGNKDLKKNNRRIMRTLAAREFQNIDLLLNFDLETMNFTEIGVVEGNALVKVTSEEALEAAKPEEEEDEEDGAGVIVEEEKPSHASHVLIPF